MSNRRRITWNGAVRALPLREQLRAAAIARCHSITVHSAKTLSYRDTAEMSTVCIFALAPIPIGPFVAATATSERRKSQDLVG
jgi:hypothetical protein